MVYIFRTADGSTTLRTGDTRDVELVRDMLDAARVALDERKPSLLN